MAKLITAEDVSLPAAKRSMQIPSSWPTEIKLEWPTMTAKGAKWQENKRYTLQEQRQTNQMTSVEYSKW